VFAAADNETALDLFADFAIFRFLEIRAAYEKDPSKFELNKVTANLPVTISYGQVWHFLMCKHPRAPAIPVGRQPDPKSHPLAKYVPRLVADRQALDKALLNTIGVWLEELVMHMPPRHIETTDLTAPDSSSSASSSTSPTAAPVQEMSHPPVTHQQPTQASNPRAPQRPSVLQQWEIDEWRRHEAHLASLSPLFMIESANTLTEVKLRELVLPLFRSPRIKSFAQDQLDFRPTATTRTNFRSAVYVAARSDSDTFLLAKTARALASIFRSLRLRTTVQHQLSRRRLPQHQPPRQRHPNPECADLDALPADEEEAPAPHRAQPDDDLLPQQELSQQELQQEPPRVPMQSRAPLQAPQRRQSPHIYSQAPRNDMQLYGPPNVAVVHALQQLFYNMGPLTCTPDGTLKILNVLGFMGEQLLA
jgi:hypothetical protein